MEPHNPTLNPKWKPKAARAVTPNKRDDTTSDCSQASQDLFGCFEEIGDMLAKHPELGRIQGATQVSSPTSSTTKVGSGSSLGKRNSGSSVAPYATPKTPKETEPSPRLSPTSLGKRKSSGIPNDSLQTPKPAKSSKLSRVPPPKRAISEPFIMAYNAQFQKGFDFRGIGFGIQWELVRRVQGNFERMDFSKLNLLMHSHVLAAPHIHEAVKGSDNTTTHNVSDKEVAAKSPWKQLDTEAEVLAVNPLGCLGGNEKYPGWYGGNVTFTAKLHSVEDSDSVERYSVSLEPPELGTSSRFARRFGSDHILRIKVQKSTVSTSNNDLLDFFSRPFVLNGRVFRAFYAKEETVFMFRTNETVASLKGDNSKLFPGISFPEFLEWHNPLECNSKQTLAKWSARFALGLSNSVPGVRLLPEHIYRIPEICETAYVLLHPYSTNEHLEVSSENSEMTDGCGFINKSALVMLRNQLSWEVFPTAIQCRISGAKGMLVIHPDKSENDRLEPCVWLRPSQVKIEHIEGQELDPANLTIDVLRSSHMKSGGRLSAQTMVCLSENGVPAKIITDLLRAALEKSVAEFLNWEDPEELWRTIAYAGGVMAARAARANPGEARAKGYGDRDPDEEDVEDEDAIKGVEAVVSRSSAWWADQISGCPSSLEETLLVLLDSGFTPTNCAVLREKLKIVVTKTIETMVSKHQVDVPMACMGFVVPDPCGVLEENEIHIKSSKRNFPTPEGLETEHIVGDVLLTRHPCKLPSDIQKLQAVERPELRNYTDVIVCSTKGKRRILDYLAGGDYDGDKCLAIWQPEIVAAFQNKPETRKFADKPEGFSKFFKREVVKVTEFLARAPQEPLARAQELQKTLLGAIADTSNVGLYSTWHDNATYSLGYSHPETIRLAYMFCETLDGGKSGQQVLPLIFAADKRKWTVRAPAWKETAEAKEALQKSASNAVNLPRGAGLRAFVMDRVARSASHVGSQQRILIEAKFCPFGRNTVEPILIGDKDLIEPWLNARRLASLHKTRFKSDWMEQALGLIKDHVEKVYEEHKAAIKTKKSFTSQWIVDRQDIFRGLSNKFASYPQTALDVLLSEDDISAYRASYAYYYDSQRSGKTGWSRFPWDVGMRELGSIKAKAKGRTNHKTLSSEFYERMMVAGKRKR